MGAGTEGTLACIRERLASPVSHLSRSVLRGLVRGELCVLLAALSYSLTSHAQRIFLLHTLYICAFRAWFASTIYADRQTLKTETAQRIEICVKFVAEMYISFHFLKSFAVNLSSFLCPITSSTARPSLSLFHLTAHRVLLGSRWM